MSKYKMTNESVGLGKTEDLGRNNLVNALNILLNNGEASVDEEVITIIEKRVVGYAQELENDKTNKGKDMQTLKDSNQEYTKEQVIEAMNLQQTTLDTHFNNFTQWSTDRKIIQNGNVLAQGLKLVSEVGELADNLAKGRCIKDDIGDCCVVLNNLVHMQGLTLDECLEQAWSDIKDRKGSMNEYGVFIKDGDVK
ncbi:Nucleoside triphosphate pyrophosphohydrolase [Psychrobacter phage D'Alembert]|nr:Nucleoside triphosphate pyrophosphohydrolase [Psychrobacter phage D'Alembert]